MEARALWLLLLVLALGSSGWAEQDVGLCEYHSGPRCQGGDTREGETGRRGALLWAPELRNPHASTPRQLSDHHFERVDCGYPAISQEDCTNRCCCFDSSIRGVPWCFKPLRKPAEIQCVFPAKERVNCGYPAIGKEDCNNRGCCFDSSTAGVPWCFKPLKKPVESQCVVPAKERVNCGYPAISQEDCSNRGCCFDSKTPGVPWCFKPLQETECTF
ncbi:hypothetical protein GHT09_013188 [Marmota monax]|uniref:Trefoil factor 3 n=1 Tax=Marmota monax TaxID=9995 RepID=A0A834QCL0_MARMO|nr:hypothetical protein GHT09_013188 [Marmota monax]